MIAGKLNIGNEKKEKGKTAFKVTATEREDGNLEMEVSLAGTTNELLNILVNLNIEVFKKLIGADKSTALNLGASITIGCIDTLKEGGK